MKKSYLISFVCFLIMLNSLPALSQSATKGKEKGHEWVDLGLSVKWATCNLGASKPSAKVKYYGWGETKPISSHQNNKWELQRGYFYSKYCTNSQYGYVDNRIRLELEDDAARKQWGGRWRMPTIKEFQELSNRCDWGWTKLNGQWGYQITGRNGNSIFLPAAGEYGRIDTDDFGMYWSSSLDGGLPVRACQWWFSDSDNYQSFYLRFAGLSIRPVLDFE